MARTPATFRQDDVTRLWRAAEANGRRVLRTEVRRDGTIVIIHDEPPVPESEPALVDLADFKL
jgi:hypothetical protein